MNLVRFSVPVENQIQKIIQEKSDFIDVKVLVLYPYYVEADFNGNSVTITEEIIKKVFETYNNSVKKKWLFFKSKNKPIPIGEIPLAQNRLDHSFLVQSVVGHVIGNYELEYEDGVPRLYAILRVKGKENVQKVKDGIYEKTSIGFSLETFETQEISWVTAGALPEAGIVVGGNSSLSLSTNNKKYHKVELENYLLNKLRRNQEEINRKRLDNEVDVMLTNLTIEGKLYPVDKLRLSQKIKFLPLELKKDFIAELGNNFKKILDYGVLSNNSFSLNIPITGFQMDKQNLSVEEIAHKAAAFLSKGKKLSEDKKDNDDKDDDDKKMSKRKLTKKDIKHAMSLSEKEAEEYLCNFAEEDEDEDNKDDKKGKKDLGINLENNEDFKTLQKNQEDIGKQLAILAKDTDEAIKLSKQIIEEMQKNGGK